MALSSDELEERVALLEGKAESSAAGTKGAWLAPTATIGAQLAPAVIAAFPTKYEKQLRKIHAGDAKALRRAGKLTPQQRAEARSIQERYEQQARMVAGRGSAVGGASGMDREAARDIRRQGRAASSEYLKGARQENIARMQQLAQRVRGTQTQLGKMADARKAQVTGAVSSAATSAATSKAMKQWGDIRRQKAADMRESGLSAAKKLSAKARRAGLEGLRRGREEVRDVEDYTPGFA